MSGTFVYVASAGDGDISTYRMDDGGRLQPGPRAKAASLVGPMTVSVDRRMLYAAVRSTPYTVYVYAIDPASGALQPIGTAPLAESFPYIALDRTGRFLLGASYSGNVLSVNAVDRDGRVRSAPAQVLPTARNPHSIRGDATNRFVFAPHLGTDQIFQFTFDERTGRLTANTPAVVQLAPGSGPRHFVLSPDNRRMYLLSEMAGTVTTLSLDAATGLLHTAAMVPGLPPGSTLVPGTARTPTSPGTPPRNRDNDIWAADIHLTPDGRYLYTSERTSSTLTVFRIGPEGSAPVYVGHTATERQPRGFAIDGAGRYLVCSGERSSTVSSYAIDAASGMLRLIGQYPVGAGANWVEIVSVA